MVTRSPSIHVTLESGFIPDLYTTSSDYSDFLRPKHKWYFIRDLKTYNATSKTKAFDIFSLNDNEAYEVLDEIAPTSYTGAVNALFQRDAENKLKQRWGNKTPEYVLHIDWLSEAFPQSQFVHVIRDPRDVSASICRAGWKNSLVEAATYWAQRVEQGRRSGLSLQPERYREVKYENLLLNPNDELSDLADWLEIEPDPEMVRFYESSQDHIADVHQDLFRLIDRPIDQSRAFAWRREMGKKEVADVERVAAPLMRKLKYEISGAKPPFKVRIARSIAHGLRPLADRVKRTLL
jgi:hypothetical protein